MVENSPPPASGKRRVRSLSGLVSNPIPPRVKPVFCLFGPYAPANRTTCASVGQ